MARTMAQKRFAQEQMLQSIMEQGGVRLAGVYGAPYPTNRDITRYHVILKIETHRTYSYEEVEITPELVAAHPRYARYAEYIGERGSKTIEGSTSYATFACGVETMTVASTDPKARLDVVEMVEIGREPATNAPICKSCARIAGMEA